MTREEFDTKLKHQLKFNDVVGMYHLANGYAKELQATIEAQEIIIKDMAQPIDEIKFQDGLEDILGGWVHSMQMERIMELIDSLRKAQS